jgi:hypothetical protein
MSVELELEEAISKLALANDREDILRSQLNVCASKLKGAIATLTEQENQLREVSTKSEQQTTTRQNLIRVQEEDRGLIQELLALEKKRMKTITLMKQKNEQLAKDLRAAESKPEPDTESLAKRRRRVAMRVAKIQRQMNQTLADNEKAATAGAASVNELMSGRSKKQQKQLRELALALALEKRAAAAAAAARFKGGSRSARKISKRRTKRRTKRKSKKRKMRKKKGGTGLVPVAKAPVASEGFHDTAEMLKKYKERGADPVPTCYCDNVKYVDHLQGQSIDGRIGKVPYKLHLVKGPRECECKEKRSYKTVGGKFRKTKRKTKRRTKRRN